MKKFAIAIAILLVTIMSVQAADKIINTKVDQVTIQISKNGNEYGRALIKETRTLSGISYESTVPVMFFGDNVKIAKALKQGDNLKVIVSEKEWNGSPSYTVITAVK
jgi:hypothetical protein